MIDFVGLFILIVLVALFGYLAFRAWGSKNAILKWVGMILSGLLTLIFVLLLVLGIVGTVKLNQNYNADHPVVEIKAATAPDRVAWAEKFASLCSGCHSPDNKVPLVGSNFGAGFPVPIGTLYAPNLTPSGELKDWTDGEIVRAFREGVHKNGRSLIIMPAEAFKSLSDDDAAALVGYIRSQPPAPQDTPRNNLNVIGAIFTAFAGLQTVQPHITQPIIAPPVGASSERGEYLVNISACRDCHGPNMAGGLGGQGGGPPIGPNLTQFVPKWSQDDFLKTIRTGVDPAGHQLTNEMPWREISSYTSDDDLKAIYTYLHAMQELPTNKPQ